MNLDATTAAAPEAARQVSCAVLIGTCGRLLLQQRDDIPHIVHPGLIGLFGGHRDPGEGALDCLIRELEEEICERIAPDRAELFLTMTVNFDAAAGGLDLSIYIVRGIPLDSVAVTEGSALIAELSGLAPLFARMTPSAAFVLRQFQLTSASQNHFEARRQAMSAQQQ